MYGKIFETIYDSSLAEDYLTRLVFMDMIVLADRDGQVDMTATALSRRINVPLDIVKGALNKLESPDEDSRTRAADGRRIERIDPKRSWGWKIINYEMYRDKGSDADRKKEWRIRKARQRLRDTLKSQGKSRDEIEKAISKFNKHVTSMSREVTGIHGKSRHTDIDKDIDTNSVGNTELVNGEKPQKVIKIHKTCEKCFKPFEPQYPGHTLCLDCFKKSKAHPTANLPKCPNPKCTIQTPNQRIDLKVGGCNFCKPEEVD